MIFLVFAFYSPSKIHPFTFGDQPLVHLFVKMTHQIFRLELHNVLSCVPIYKLEEKWDCLLFDLMLVIK